MHGLPAPLLISGAVPVPPGADFTFTVGTDTGSPERPNIGYQLGWPAPAAASGTFPGQLAPPQRFADISDGSGNRFEMQVSCTINPGSFTSILIFELGITLLSVDATFIAGCGINTFRWPALGTLVFGATYNVFVT